MAPKITALTGDSIYLFFDLKTPFLALLASGTVAAQLMLLYVFWWAAQADNEKGDYSYGTAPTCSSDYQPQVQCEAINHSTALGNVAAALITLVVQGPDVIRGCRLMVHCKFATAAAMIVMALIGMFINLQYVGATSEQDSTIVINSVVILMVNQLDEWVFSFVWACAPSWVDLQKERIDGEDKEPSSELQDLTS